MAEHWSCKPGVESSILSGGIDFRICWKEFLVIFIYYLLSSVMKVNLDGANRHNMARNVVPCLETEGNGLQWRNRLAHGTYRQYSWDMPGLWVRASPGAATIFGVSVIAKWSY